MNVTTTLNKSWGLNSIGLNTAMQARAARRWSSRTRPGPTFFTATGARHSAGCLFVRRYVTFGRRLYFCSSNASRLFRPISL